MSLWDTKMRMRVQEKAGAVFEESKRDIVSVRGGQRKKELQDDLRAVRYAASGRKSRERCQGKEQLALLADERSDKRHRRGLE